MITLHHLGRPHNPFALNRDLILSVEARPDTVITLTTGDKLLVRESADEVVELVRQSRADVLAQGLVGHPARVRRADERPPRAAGARQHSEAALTVVEPDQRPADRLST